MNSTAVVHANSHKAPPMIMFQEQGDDDRHDHRTLDQQMMLWMDRACVQWRRLRSLYVSMVISLCLTECFV
jgi:hypothetical protein